jgi:cytochrome c biogenesis protein CcmG, thiol:disulfide interchange protein DsbE
LEWKVIPMAQSISTDHTETYGRPAHVISRRRLLYAVPAVGFVGLAAIFAWGIGRDPSRLPSTLIGKPVPTFRLPPVAGRTLGLSSDDLHGEVSLVNVFASWCVACRFEHPLFLRLAQDKTVPIHGLNYKDRPEDAAHWLNTLGDPYTRTGADQDGRVAIEWGVYGVPETFVIGADGRVAHKHIGPVDEQTLNETILPMVERLRQQAKGGRP